MNFKIQKLLLENTELLDGIFNLKFSILELFVNLRHIFRFSSATEVVLVLVVIAHFS